MRMAGPDAREEGDVDGWVKEEKSLGSGGFGTVSLWVNKETGEKIAVKRCRMISELTKKHKERWKMEVEIMLRLDHPNVVAAMALPEVLLRPDDELPPMAMEYCSGGDLRKVLIKAENCTGLPEYMVRSILNDVGSGMEYLHSHRIIHRDLKPENIVLQKTDCDDGKMGRKVVYKVIDLGYAKDLDQGSVCTSFVGTPQYLAPELLEKEPKYTSTVDYWSFGILAFEIIVGSRPFLPTKSPFQWHEPVRKKPDEVIHVYHDTKGEIVYSKQLPSPNHLCRTSQQDIQHWLRLMLRWNPRVRGGDRNEKKRTLCFRMLEDFLSVKMIFVFCIYTNHMLSFKVKDDDTVHNLQLRLQAETKIAVAEQELLLNTGLSLDPKKPARVYAADLQVEDDGLVFFFRKGSVHFPSKLLKRHLPDTVQSMIKDPKAMLTYPDQKKIWSHSVHFCQESALEYRRLTYGQRAAMMALLRSAKTLSNLKIKVSEEMTKLGAQAEFFQYSLTSDLVRYEEQASAGGFTSKKLHNSWQEMAEDVNKIYTLRDPVRSLDEETNAMSTKISELHKSPFSKTKRVTKLDEIHLKAVSLYAELKALAKEQRHGQLLDNRKMVNCIAQSISQREADTAELYKHLSKIQTYRLELEGLLPRLNSVLIKVQESQRQLKLSQEKKQDEVWGVLKQLIKQNAKKSSPGNSMLDSGSMSGSLSGSPSSMVTSYLEKSLEESLLILNENENTKSRLEEMMSSLVEETPQQQASLRDIDWEFLSNPKK